MSRVAFIAACLLIINACGKPSAEDHLSRGNDFLEQNNLNAAVIEFRSAANLAPDMAEARWRLGQALLKIGSGPAAEKEIRTARELGLDNEEMQFALARAMLIQNDAVRAWELMSDYTPAKPSAAHATLLGDIVAQNSALSGAQAHYLKALELDPKWSDAMLGLARLALSDGDSDKAAEWVAKAAALNDGNFETLVVQGNVAFYQRKYAESAAAFIEAEKAAPYLLIAHLGAAQALLAAGKTQEAVPHIDKALGLAPSSPLAATYKAYTMADMDDLQPAIDLCRSILNAYPEQSRARFLLGVLLYRKGELQQAAETLKVYTQKNSMDLNARKLLATIELSLGTPTEAVKTIIQNIDIDQVQDPQIHVALATAYLQSGNPEQAQVHFNRAAALAPETLDYGLRARILELVAGDPEVALSALKEMAREKPDFAPSQKVVIAYYMQQGKLDDALAVAQDALIHSPNDPVIHHLLATVALAKGERVAARGHLETALRASATYVPAALDMASLDMLEGDKSGARGRLERILEQSPTNIAAMALLATLTEDPDKARQLLENCHEVNARYLPCLTGLTNLYLSAGRLDDAQQLGLQALQLNPRDPQLNLTLGDIAIARGKPDEALKFYEPLALANPEVTEVLTRLIQTERQLERFDTSEARLRGMLENDPTDPGVLALLASVQAARGDSVTAARTIGECLRVDENSQICGEFAGDLAFSQKDYSKAVGHYERAFGRAPSSNLVSKQYRALSRLGRAEDARQLLDGWLAEHPNDLHVLFLQADAFDAAGQSVDGIAVYEKILEVDPTNVVALNNLALRHYENGDKRALEYAKRALEAAPGNANVKDTYGWILVNTGSIEQGRAQIESAIIGDPKNPTFKYHFAVAALKMGDRRKAEEALIQALGSSRFPEREAAEKLHATLK